MMYLRPLFSRYSSTTTRQGFDRSVAAAVVRVQLRRRDAPSSRPRQCAWFSNTAAADTATTATPDNHPPPIIWTTHRLNNEQIEKVDRIFHKILWLDIFESQMLTDLLNERLGLRMTDKQRKQLEARMMREESMDGDTAGDGTAAEEEAAAGPVTLDVKLVGFDAKAKIKVIKEVRGSIDGLGLKEAKEMVEGVPVLLQKGLKEDAANSMKEKLEAVGAQIELVPV